MSEDTRLKELIINTLSPEQFEGIDPSTEEIYLVEDDVEYATVEEVAIHTDDTTIHVTEQDKTTWNGKQDKPTITKSNNNNGIVKHPDGRMEQWGIATSSNVGETEFTMNNSFIDTNFQVFIEPRQAGDLVHYAIPSSTNKFKARIQNTSGAYMTCQFQWRAYGFWK